MGGSRFEASGVWSRYVTVLTTVAGILLTARYAYVAWARRAPADARYPYQNVVMTDFRDTAFLPVRALAAGVNPYDMGRYQAMFPYAQEFNAYAPWWLSVCEVFRWLSWDDAALLGSTALASATALLAVWSGRWIRMCVGDVRWGIALAPMMLCFVWFWRPTTLGHGLGNPGAVVALAAAGVLLSAGESWVGAALLAVAWLKPQFGLPLVLVLVLRRQWRTALGGTMLAGALSLPAVVRLSQVSGGFLPWVQQVLASTAEVAARTESEPLEGRIDLVGMLSRSGIAVPTAAAVVVALALLGLGIWADHAATARGLTWQGKLLLGGFLLIATPHLHYDMALLAPLVFASSLELVVRPTFHYAKLEMLNLACPLLIAVGSLVPGQVFPTLPLYNAFLGIWLSFALGVGLLTALIVENRRSR